MKNQKNYSIYVGLNDKDQKIQLISTFEAGKIAQKLVCKFFGGGTIYETDGVYTHENGAIVIEKTLKIELIGIEDVENVNEFIKTLKTMLNYFYHPSNINYLLLYVFLQVIPTKKRFYFLYFINMKNITINGDTYTFKKFEPFTNCKTDIYDLYKSPSAYKIAAYEEWKYKLDCIYGWTRSGCSNGQKLHCTNYCSTQLYFGGIKT